MKRITLQDYLDFVKAHGEVAFGDSKIKLEPIKVTRLVPEDGELTDVSTTVWSFPERGSWATHKGDYRGNFAPQIPRAVILKYTKPGDLVLDPMVGSGTTCVEAILLGRDCIGVDININAVMLAFHRVYWLEKYLEECKDCESLRKAKVELYLGDARDLKGVEDSSIDLVVTHPPYFNIIDYMSGVEGDLSNGNKLEDYIKALSDVGREVFRVLKDGKQFAVLLGDTRIRKHYVPITAYALMSFLNLGFVLREEVIKIQHKMKTTREVWIKAKRDFLLIYHEKMFIFDKVVSEKELGKYKYSSRAFLDKLGLT
ncbi:TRM11 family SAM-dependent methyltransferase [Stygiolobus caldivivus]|uniref:Type II methyltransferase n=1 Tax=Stygiolobus caldivivus TaxID=2824673 RepID=A0A8D5ZIK1_9CREN|nr:site-specific DNA-methyltransferase [Stygiolobus caldivivus]BCU69691.1 hypothetical protein KN1_09880 [Stygiolobus caldivivus]